MNKKLLVRVQKIAATLPLTATGFANTLVINPDDASLALKKGTLYAVFDVNSNVEYDALVTTKVVNDILHNAYYLSEATSPIQALEKAVLEVKEKVTGLISGPGKQVDFNILVAALWGNVAYIVQFGHAKSFLVREGALNQINASTEGYFSVSSGIVRDSDVIVLESEEFSKTYPAEKLLSENLTANLSSRSAALILKFTLDASFAADESVSGSFSRDRSRHTNAARAPLANTLAKLGGLVSTTKNVFAKNQKLKSQSSSAGVSSTGIRLKSGKSRVPSKSTIFTLLIAGLFIGSIAFTVARNREKDKNEQTQVLGDQTNENVFIKVTDKPAEVTPQEQAQQDSATKTTRTDAQIFYDLKLVEATADPTDIAVVGNTIFVSDKTLGALFSSLVATPKFVKETGLFNGIQALAFSQGKLAFSDAHGYNLYDGATSKIANTYTFTRAIGFPTATYLDFIYEVSDDKITKFTKDGTTLTDSLWAQSADFQGVSAMAINVAIYLGKSDGTLLSYTRGINDNLTVTGLDTPLGAIVKIALDTEKDLIYIADKANRRVVVLNTQGQLVKQLKHANASSWDDIRSIDLNGNASKLFVLNGSKVYEIDL